MTATNITKERAIEVLSDELHLAEYDLNLVDTDSEDYKEAQELVDALTLAVGCIQETL